MYALLLCFALVEEIIRRILKIQPTDSEVNPEIIPDKGYFPGY